MDKNNIISLINRAKMIEILTLPSVATDHQIDQLIKKIRENLRQNSRKERIVIQVIAP